LGLAALIAVGLAVRLWVLGARNELNADEVIPGLMARHIATGADLPVFFYGQSYFGAVEAYLLAGLFAAFGFHAWLAVVPPLAASLALVPITYALGCALGGRPAGWLAALPVAVPPPVLAALYTNSGGGFALAFALHGGALLCYLRAYLPAPAAPGAAAPGAAGAAGGSGEETRLRWAMAYSLVSGVLCWIWQPALVLYPVLLALLLWRQPGLRRPRRLVLAAAPMLVGLAPPLLYNLLNGWPSVAQLAHKVAAPPGTEGGPGFGTGAAAIWSLVLIAAGGGDEAEGGTSFLLSTLVAGAVPLTLLLLTAAGRRAAEGPRAGLPDAPAGAALRPAERRRAAWILALVLALDVLAAHNTARHVVPAVHLGFAFAGAALALGAARLWPSRPWTRRILLGVAGLALVVLPDLWLDAHAGVLFRRFVAPASDVATAAEGLAARGLTTGYADYWTAYPVTYLSGERAVLAPAVASVWGERVDRYPPYGARVDAVDDLGALFLLLDDRCSPVAYLLPLEQEGATYRLEHLARWYLLWDVQASAGDEARTLAKWRHVIFSRAHC
jgi:hypothetical protein